MWALIRRRRRRRVAPSAAPRSPRRTSLPQVRGASAGKARDNHERGDDRPRRHADRGRHALGEGGMGIVWRAWLFHAPSTPRGAEPPLPVALKVLSPRARGKAELRALFVHEAEAMRALSHPNVVRFHTLGRSRERAGDRDGVRRRRQPRRGDRAPRRPRAPRQSRRSHHRSPRSPLRARVALLPPASSAPSPARTRSASCIAT